VRARAWKETSRFVRDLGLQIDLIADPRISEFKGSKKFGSRVIGVSEI